MKYPLFVQLIGKVLTCTPIEEYRFHPTRRWRFDIAVPELKIAVEIEGGTWIQGRHTRGKGYQEDMEKYNQAQLLGWRVFRYTPNQLGECLRDLKNLKKETA
jgi:very-short-patch-repair endonuclease